MSADSADPRAHPVTDPFAVLGVSRDADPREVSRAYRRLLRRHHPDLRVTGSGADAVVHADLELAAVMAAYEVLRRRAHRASAASTGAAPASTPQGDTPQGAAPGGSASGARADGIPSGGEPPIRAGPVYWWPASRR